MEKITLEQACAYLPHSVEIVDSTGVVKTLTLDNINELLIGDSKLLLKPIKNRDKSVHEDDSLPQSMLDEGFRGSLLNLLDDKTQKVLSGGFNIEDYFWIELKDYKLLTKGLFDVFGLIEKGLAEDRSNHDII